MIKVISIDPNFIRRGTCNNCASVLEFTRSDCTESTRFGENGWIENYWYIFCPNCDNQLVIHHGGKFD